MKNLGDKCVESMHVLLDMTFVVRAEAAFIVITTGQESTAILHNLSGHLNYIITFWTIQVGIKFISTGCPSLVFPVLY